MLARLFTDAGLKSKVLTDIRSHLWVKASGNLAFNPISALTRATLVDICRFPETRALSTAMMREAMEIAEKLGVTFRHTIEQRNRRRRKGRKAQDLDAPGPRGRADPGAGRPGWRGR